MSKRVREEGDCLEGSHKRRNLTTPPTTTLATQSWDRLSRLPDELILRVLSFLDVEELINTQLLSRKLCRLSEDSNIWRSLFYEQFVWPRVKRRKGAKQEDVLSRSRASRWMEDAFLLDPALKTDWKRQYRLRYNWSNGRCTVQNIRLDVKRGRGMPHVQMHSGYVYAVDAGYGLRVWRIRDDQDPRARMDLFGQGMPTALAIDGQTAADSCRIIVGFSTGDAAIFTYDYESNTFIRETVLASRDRSIVATVAIAWPYVLVMAYDNSTSLHRLTALSDTDSTAQHGFRTSAKLVHRLKSTTVHGPLAMSLRVLKDTTSISIAFTSPCSVQSTWTVGIQEIWISHQTNRVTSHLDYAVEKHHPRFKRQPTSMSYHHPYLLASHSDNTLTLYLVHGGPDSLTIGSGNRLWGHTSSVSHAHVGSRGRAISVGRHGGEIRVWELERGYWRQQIEATSIRLQPRNVSSLSRKPKAKLLDKFGCPISRLATCSPYPWDFEDEFSTKQKWTGSDEENVVVLKEELDGQQTLVLYNFA